MVTSSVDIYRPKGNPAKVSPFQIVAMNAIKKLGGTCYFRVTGEYEEDGWDCDTVEEANAWGERYDNRGDSSYISLVIP